MQNCRLRDKVTVDALPGIVRQEAAHHWLTFGVPR
jgi:hypothetical protein